MSWKMHSLGNKKYSYGVANAAIPVLTEYGYTCTFSYDYATTGQMDVAAPNGEAYVVGVGGQNDGDFPYYLFVNDETWEFVITMYSTSKTASSSLKYVICAALLRGTDMDTGADGLFSLYIDGSSPSADSVTNMWKSSVPSGKIGLQKALFFAYSNAIQNGFHSELFWGSSAQSPGVVVTIAAGNFLCLSQQIYVKL